MDVISSLSGPAFEDETGKIEKYILLPAVSGVRLLLILKTSRAISIKSVLPAVSIIFLFFGLSLLIWANNVTGRATKKKSDRYFKVRRRIYKKYNNGNNIQIVQSNMKNTLKNYSCKTFPSSKKTIFAAL